MLKVQSTFKNNLPTIYLVGTPIGNLNDISKRVIETFENVEVIYCEDTRVSIKLIEKLKLSKKLKSLHKFNEYSVSPNLIEDLNKYKNIAIISDAGVPCISDPGAIVIRELIEKNIEVNITSINCGPAYIHAIVACGFVAKRNLFLGFIDKKNIEKELQKILNDNHNNDVIISFYESVHRIQSTLNQLALLLNENTNVVVVRELTKLNEEFLRGTIFEICDYINNNQLVLKGEFCIVIDSKFTLKNDTKVDMEKVISEVQKLISQNISKKDAIKNISKKYSVNKNELTKYFYKE
ncbi:16S rRNA (cytidine(1402)-2'-O)-methyltransferase [Spiroplasma cantharicola]|uniref:16S rRNA (Cytidine1402-2'-O)-methyltransferase n=1 Tax=Spiroplasma cantharicola TaxID=362837 RepID=A0A0M3SJ51_9MOLU|nr:16S rRNA (cytidine(1402)-2'-O)-methyltransferase [Spiroplasma cantharicola]ALD66138.1 16S rRNA (cytidine1402-2'-O)-methyltransferase [Spiroplasma cantharicola]